MTFGEHHLPPALQVFAAWRAYRYDPRPTPAEIAPIQAPLRTLVEDASPKNRRHRWHR